MYEAWDNYNQLLVGTYDTKEEAKIAAWGYAIYKGIFKSDISVYYVENE